MSLFFVLVGVLLVVLITGLHEVSEGHIGMYYLGGKLLDSVTHPGFHWMLPFVTKFNNVQVTLQTDTVTNIPCGTSGGSVIYFDKIEVVNSLDASKAFNTIKLYGVNYDRTWIFDRIHHEINQFCSSHSLQEVYIDKFDSLDEALATALQSICDKFETGIQITAIRVTKPRIPESVKKNYEAIETAKTELLVRVEQEKVAKKEEDTSFMRASVQAKKEAEVARINAEKVANVSKINAEREMIEKEAEKKKRAIDDEINLNHQKAQTDAEFYRMTKQAEAHERLYTENYLRYILYTSLANNTKIYFGNKIPTIFADLIPPNTKLPFP